MRDSVECSLFLLLFFETEETCFTQNTFPNSLFRYLLNDIKRKWTIERFNCNGGRLTARFELQFSLSEIIRVFQQLNDAMYRYIGIEDNPQIHAQKLKSFETCDKDEHQRHKII